MRWIHCRRESTVTESPEILRTIRTLIDKTHLTITGVLYLILVIRIRRKNHICCEVDVLDTIIISDRKNPRLLRCCRSCERHI